MLRPRAQASVSWSSRTGRAFREALVSVNHLPVSTIERSQPRSRHEQQETAGGGVSGANLEETVYICHGCKTFGVVILVAVYVVRYGYNI